MRDWLADNTSEAIFLDIRDTRENEVTSSSDQSQSLANMVADPLFVDAAHDDYRLQPGSPALASGFQPLPVDQMGPVGRFRGR